MFKESFKYKLFYVINIVLLFFILMNLKIFFIKEKIWIKNFEQSNYIFTKNEYYILEGRANNFKDIEINGKKIFLDYEHNFSEKFFLNSYENVFYFRGIHKNNNKIQRKIRIFK